MAPQDNDYPPIADYGLIGDCRTAALVSRQGSIDWCCLPRFDSGAAFARLLDRERGGYCSVAPRGDSWTSSRRYVDDTLVLETTFEGRGGNVTLYDFFSVTGDGERGPQLIRVLEVTRGSVDMEVRIAPRFDYGEVRPWIRRHGHRLFSAIGGNDGLVVWCDEELEENPEHELTVRFTMAAGDRRHLSLTYCAPEKIDAHEGPDEPDAAALDAALDEAVSRWRKWTETLVLQSDDEPGARRSGLTLKALTYEPTGAIVAAPTTSLPEALGGPRNWDYRFAWVRDASFSARAFAELGAVDEADAFRAFIMRSAAGHAGDLQVLYGPGGERRIRGETLAALEGYQRSSPVRTGNDAAGQRQLDAYGELVNLTWRWHRRGHSPSDDDWRFLVSLIDHAAENCSEPDQGIWEWPGDPQHFVHSKVLCWSALDRGIRLADECMRRAPTRRWKRARDELREEIDRRGYDSEARRLRAGLRTQGSRRGAAAAAHRRVRRVGRREDAADRRGDPGGARRRATACSTATAATTVCQGRRARFCAARSGWSSAWRAAATSSRRARCSTWRSPRPTISGCSRRRSNRSPASCWAISRRG